MKIYQITDRGHRFAQNPRLPSIPTSQVLWQLDKRTGGTKEQIVGLTGLSEGETTVALMKLQSAGLVVGV